jgi:hypothetical protein
MVWGATSLGVTEFDRRVAHSVMGYALEGWRRRPSEKQAVYAARGANNRSPRPQSKISPRQVTTRATSAASERVQLAIGQQPRIGSDR